jgi:transcriptional regulator with XRE-family HTH domain
MRGSPGSIGSPGPTVRRRQLATELRRFRREAGLSVTDVAHRLLCSPSKISRIETGRRSATLRDVRDLCQMYGITNAAREALMTMARESRQAGWWEQWTVDPATETLIGLEGSAATIREFALAAVPGLLQTRRYAESILSMVTGPGTERAHAVELRIERQRILREANGPEYDVVIDEAVLHRQVGDTGVMDEQLNHLIETAQLPNVQLRVMPFIAGAHPGLGSSFTMLDFRQRPDFQEAEMSPVLYVEGLAGEPHIKQGIDFERHLKAFEVLENISLSHSLSVQAIQSANNSMPFSY